MDERGFQLMVDGLIYIYSAMGYVTTLAPYLTYFFVHILSRQLLLSLFLPSRKIQRKHLTYFFFCIGNPAILFLAKTFCCLYHYYWLFCGMYVFIISFVNTHPEKKITFSCHFCCTFLHVFKQFFVTTNNNRYLLPKQTKRENVV